MKILLTFKPFRPCSHLHLSLVSSFPLARAHIASHGAAEKFIGATSVLHVLSFPEQQRGLLFPALILVLPS